MSRYLRGWTIFLNSSGLILYMVSLMANPGKALFELALEDHIDREGMIGRKGWRLEIGSWKLEVGGWKLEVGCWRLVPEIKNFQNSFPLFALLNS